MRKYIMFLAEVSNSEGWQDRKLSHTQALTDILAEYWDSSDQPLPEPGYRPTEYVRVDDCVDPRFPTASTHYRPGDWEVVRVHTYTPDIPVPYGAVFDVIALCYCRYAPIDAPMQPTPTIQVTLDSFGGDQDAYDDWLHSEADQYSKV